MLQPPILGAQGQVVLDDALQVVHVVQIGAGQATDGLVNVTGNGQIDARQGHTVATGMPAGKMLEMLGA